MIRGDSMNSDTQDKKERFSGGAVFGRYEHRSAETVCNLHDIRASETIQSRVLRYLAWKFDSVGETLARNNDWEVFTTSAIIAGKVGISQKQAKDALYRLKHRRHMIWYRTGFCNRVYIVRVPEHWYWRKAYEL